MSKDCNHDCGSCGEDCSSRSLIEKPHPQSKISKVIGIVSGKGGVGKSLVTSLLAVAISKTGKQVAVLDADITGPSIPKAFGIHGHATGDDTGIFPAVSSGGIKIMSSNLLLANENDPVIWRGPLIAGMVKQFWTDVIWGHVDCMFVDLPPGTGDVPLTVFQSFKLDGIIVVTTPQELVSMIVEKAVKMAQAMNIPVLGLVENLSFAVCPDCGKHFNVYGASKLNEVAEHFNLKILAKLPINPALATACDKGEIEKAEVGYLDATIKEIMK